jgi:hypothetical protein
LVGIAQSDLVWEFGKHFSPCDYVVTSSPGKTFPPPGQQKALALQSPDV